MTALPASLVRFRGELEEAIRRDRQPPRRSRRRVVPRIAVATGAAVAAAVGAFTALPGDPGRGFVEPASAAQQAAAALAATPGSIVHVETVVSQRDPAGSLTSWREESWQRTTPPYERRQIVTGGNGERVETATVDGNHQLYEPQTNTVRVTSSASGRVTPEPATAQPFREQVLDLLRSGKLTRSGRSTVEGRQTISFVWNDGQTRYEYTVDAGTYDPVRWRFSPTTSDGETTITFDTYEILPADHTPIDLRQHHPDAKVQRQP